MPRSQKRTDFIALSERRFRNCSCRWQVKDGMRTGSRQRACRAHAQYLISTIADITTRCDAETLGSRIRGARMGLLEWLFGAESPQSAEPDSSVEPVHLARAMASISR